jgi:hypothetical protein
MRVVTATLAAAIEAAERTVDATVHIDWDGDGYNTVDSGDTFDRAAVPTGWGDSTTGFTWTLFGIGGTVAAGNWATTGTTGTVTVPTAVSFRVSVIPLADLDVTDNDVTAEWSSAAPTGGDLEPANIALRLQGINDYLLARVLLAPGGAVKVAFLRLVGAVETTLLDPTVIPGLVFDPGVHWNTRAQVIGTRLRVMVWPVTADPPAVWHAVIDDDTWTSGSWGLRTGRGGFNTNAGVTATYHQLTVAHSAEDDISGKVASLSVTRDLRGQLPDEVLVVEGISAATADADLAAGSTADEQLNTVRYFSRTNPGSPLYGKTRDSRPAKVAARFLTDAGFESAPRLTAAVLRALPVNAADRSARLDLIDGRDRFRLPITLPAVIADGPWDGTATIPTKPGLEASWVVSYVLSRCGYPLSPQPRAECRLFIPFHGSAVPFVQTAFAGSPRAKWEASTTDTNPQRVQFTDDAPYFLAADPGAGFIQLKAPVNAVPSDGWDSVGRAKGIRIEHWVKRSGTEPVVDAVVTEVYNDAAPTQSRIKLFTRTDGFLAVQVRNGPNSYFVFSPVTFAAGAWHYVGVHVDDVNGRIAFRIDGTTYTQTHALTTANTLATAAVACDVKAYAPIAELHVSMCDEATAWLPTAHVPGASVARLQNRQLSGIYPDKAVESWTVLQQVTAAEMGTCRIDYDGEPTIWAADRRLHADSLTVQRTVTARQHLMDLAYDDSRDMVRNLIKVPFQQYATAGLVPVWSLTELVSIGPSVTQTYNVKLEKPLAGSVVALAAEAWVTADGSVFGYVGITDVVANGLRLTATVTSPTTVTITITNIVGTTLWIVDTNGIPNLIMSGTPITKVDTEPVQVSDAAAIARRGGPGIGEAPLDVDDNPWRQSAAFARGIGFQLLATLRDEQIVLTDVRIPGDPRLEDLDRIQIQDPDGLVYDAPVLIEGISDQFAPGGYGMTLVARPARDQWILGASGTPLGVAIVGGTNPGGSPDPDPGGGLDEEWEDMATALLVAAVDAPADIIADADYACDGVADEVEIQAAIAAAKVAGGKKVLLSPGTFAIAAPINLDGVDDVNVDYEHRLAGCGPSNTKLNVAAGIAAGIRLRDCTRVQLQNFGLFIDGATDGIQAVAGTSAGGYRSAWLSDIRNIQVIGPFDGGDTGWAMDLDNVFRSVIENIEINGTTNGIRFYNSDSAFNAGDCTVNRVFVDLGNGGNNGAAYAFESAAGNLNQAAFLTCHSIANASATGTVAWKFSGAGNTSHIRAINCNVEQFAKTAEISSTSSDIDLDLVHVTQRNGTTLFDVAGFNSRLRAGLCYIEPSATVTVINDTNSYAEKPNVYERIDGYVDTGGTANVTLGSTAVLRDSVWDGSGATIAAALRKPPGVAQSKAVTLTDAATVATDASLGNYFRVTLGGNRTLGAPTNPTDGQMAAWEFRQDGTGSRTITLNAAFVLATGLSSTLTTTANRYDVMTAVYNATAAKWWVTGFAKNLV